MPNIQQISVTSRGTRNPKGLIGSVHYDLKNYEKYIEQAIKFTIGNNAIELRLEKEVIEIKEEVVEKNKREKIRKEIRYKLVSLHNKKESERIERDLFEKDRVKCLYSKRPEGSYKKNKEFEVDILSRSKEHQYIILDLNSNEKTITLYLRTGSEYQLIQQKKAIQKLHFHPSTSHLPILKLFDNSKRNTEKFFLNNYDEDIIIEDWLVLKDLERSGTEQQRNFVEIAMKTRDFALLEGPPGSGKTTTIIELILQCVRRGERVLLCSATHVAVDNVLARILEKEEFRKMVTPLRICSDDRQVRKDEVTPYILKNYVRKMKTDVKKELAKKKTRTASQTYFYKNIEKKDSFDKIILDAANVVGGTMIGILQHPDIKNGTVSEPFDVLIVDEASKVTFQDFIVPALHAKKWILVGDIQQLSPYSEDEYIGDALKKIVSPKKQNLCMTLFDLRKSLTSQWDNNTLHILLSDEIKVQEIDFIEKDLVYDLSQFQQNKQEVLKLNAALLVIGKNTKQNKKIINQQVFVKARLYQNHEENNKEFDHRQQYFKVNRQKKKQLPTISKVKYHAFKTPLDENQEWSEMVASRLSQAYDYREQPELSERINQELSFLYPNEYQNRVEEVKRHYLPSILEILQRGQGERKHEKGDTYQKVFYNGFSDAVKKKKFLALEYQHRMEEAIARLPRECFYNAEKLKTANTVTKKRENKLKDYKRNEEAIKWHPVRDETWREEEKNVNPSEISAIIDELDSFAEFCSDNPQQKYEVAVLSFYNAQVSELQNKIRKWYRKWHKKVQPNVWIPKNNNRLPSRNFRLDKGFINLKITLCTVDKFQGDEADMVLLSFVKYSKGAFYKSPNRLNVALTRARLKLVLFGNRAWLEKYRPSDALYRLANEVDERTVIHSRTKITQR